SRAFGCHTLQHPCCSIVRPDCGILPKLHTKYPVALPRWRVAEWAAGRSSSTGRGGGDLGLGREPVAGSDRAPASVIWSQGPVRPACSFGAIEYAPTASRAAAIWAS